jgi:hypothetical protein
MRAALQGMPGVAIVPSSHLAAIPEHEGGNEEEAHLLYIGAPWLMAPRRMSVQAH